jgi:hypothetical protein
MKLLAILTLSAVLAVGASVAVARDARPSAARVHKQHVVGGIRYVGGPAGSHDDEYQPGLVRLRRNGRTVARQELAARARYDFRVAPGRYTLTTSLGGVPCRRSVKVKTRRLRVDLVCSIK